MPEYVTMTEAARRLGLSDPAFRLRVRRGQIAAYLDPTDWRRKLVRVADLDAYAATRRAIPAGAMEDAVA